MEPFIPPGFNLPLHWTIDFSFPLLLKTALNLDAIEISEEDRRRLRELRERRLIVFCNHPTNAEPAIIYHMGNVMGARFHYMASRQVFDQMGGMMGKLIQGLGAFSILPGAPDQDSVRTARSLLCETAGKLVLFPEGEPCSGENDVLMPFQPGAAQVAFWAYEDLQKRDPGSDVHMLGVFVKYLLSGRPDQIEDDLGDSLRRLESRLGIRSEERSPLRRILHAGRLILEEAERNLQLSIDGLDLEDRIDRIRHELLDRLAARYSVHGYVSEGKAIEKLRYMLSIIEMKQVGFPDPRLPDMSPADLEYAKRECQKVYTFIGMRPDYLLEHPSAERLMEWIQHFEEYLYGSSRQRARSAWIQLAEPCSVSEFHESYGKARKTGLAEMNERLRAGMEGMRDQALLRSRTLINHEELQHISEDLR